MGGHKSVAFVWPELLYDYQPGFKNKPLLRRVVASNEPAAADWVEQHLDSLATSGPLLAAPLWELVPKWKLLPSELKGHAQEFMIYNAHREIELSGASLAQRQSANTLLTYIVWFCAARDDREDAIARGHIYSLRRLLIVLANKGWLPVGDELAPSREWVLELEKKVADDGGIYQDEIALFRLLFFGELSLGKRQRDADPSERKKRRTQVEILVSELWASNSLAESKYSTAPFTDGLQPSITQAAKPPKKVSEDDSQANDFVELANSKRVGRDAAVFARRLGNTILLANVSGYHHKETYTPQVAGSLLHCLTPRSPEAILAVLATVMGRDLKHIKEITIEDGMLRLDSVQSPSAGIFIVPPEALNVECALNDLPEAKKQFSKKIKREIKSLGSRQSFEAMARFGVMKLHGFTSIVQSEQMQGSCSVGEVTATYAELTADDFQNGFSTVLNQFCCWISSLERQGSTAWSDWVDEIRRSINWGAKLEGTYGSSKLWKTDSAAQKKAASILRDSYSCFESEVLFINRRDEAETYLEHCAKSLNLAFMEVTGARPLTITTKISLGRDYVCVADKRCYGNLETRMLVAPKTLLAAIGIHLENVAYLLEKQGVAFEKAVNEMRHPFVSVRRGKSKIPGLHHLEQGEVFSWQKSLAVGAAVGANALRHNLATELISSGCADGEISSQLGHDRGVVSGASPYQSMPALVGRPMEDAWIPRIRRLSEAGHVG